MFPLTAQAPTFLSPSSEPASPSFTSAQTATLDAIGQSIDSLGNYPTATVNFQGVDCTVETGRIRGPMEAGANVFIVGENGATAAYTSDREGSRVQTNGMSVATADQILDLANNQIKGRVLMDAMAKPAAEPANVIRP